MKFRWSLAPPQRAHAERLAEALKLPPLLAQCLLNRNLTEPSAAAAFLWPRLRQLADPFLLPHMPLAVERLLQARERKEPVVLFGDYDVDGVTACALLLEVLCPLGWQVQYYLPRRLEEGYGLSQEAVENCLAQSGATLLLAVDCGSTAVAPIAWLRQRGVEVIVLDHHQISVPAPAAIALVNPRLSASCNASESEDSGAPFTELCSVGLAFKLAHALLKRARETSIPGAADFDLRSLLDLVALGTIADVVPLTGENRILASVGLERLCTTQRPGLVALKQVAQSPALLGSHEVAFQLAPRLNAAGRLETAEEALRLLLTREHAEARTLAQTLDVRNRTRQKIERGIVEDAIAAVQNRFNPGTDYVIVEGNPTWHIGVVGIVAARVLQQFYRPTVILGGDGATYRGSGRSIPGFNLAGALRECADLLLRQGGHAMAAGVSLLPANLDAFRVRLNQLALNTLQPEDLQPSLRLDAEVRLVDLHLECLAALAQLRPTGQDNPPVQLFARKLNLHRPPLHIGAQKQHLKLWINDGTTALEAVWWNAADQTLPPVPFDLAFAPQINEYNGSRSVQLKILDWRPAQ